MAYRLHGEAPPGVELCSVAIEQIHRACVILRDPDLPVAQRVHGARKRIKMLRAIMRLLRGPLGDRFGDVNRLLRDAGRALSASRDAEVVRNTFAEVVAADVPGASDLIPVTKNAQAFAALVKKFDVTNVAGEPWGEWFSAYPGATVQNIQSCLNGQG